MVATTETKHACFLRQAECRLPRAFKKICHLSPRASRHNESTPAEARVIVRILDASVPDAPIKIARFVHQIARDLLLAWSVRHCLRITDEGYQKFKEAERPNNG